MKTVLRIIFGLLLTVILLSFCDSWIFSNSEYDWLENLNEPLYDELEDFEPDPNFDWNGNVRAKRAEKKYFTEHDEPLVHSQRCDACRIIANKIHIGFELAESKVGIKTHSFDEFEELADEEVLEVSKQVCSKGTYKYVLPVILRGLERLAASELETFSYLNLPQSSNKEKSDINWPRRLRNHCTYMMKNLQGRDVYDMWLKTSVGEGHSQGRGFSEFLCFGEGMFSDCVDRDRVIDTEGNVNWPGGDDPEEDELYEYEDDGWETTAELMEQLGNTAASSAMPSMRIY